MRYRLAWVAVYLAACSAVLVYWMRDYQLTQYSDQVGWPYAFYEFQGGVAGTVTDRFSTTLLVADVAIVLVALGLACALMGWVGARVAAAAKWR